MLTIGYANVFYTLWYVTEETCQSGNETYKIFHFNFVKNISKSYDVAREQYPDAPYNETLKGKSRSFTERKRIEYSVDCFGFGKYTGKELVDCEDYPYLMWYYNADLNPARRAIIRPILIAQGYGFTDTDQCLDPVEWDEFKEYEELRIQARERIENSNVDFTPTCNPDCDGLLLCNEITYHFPNVKECYYQGFSYYIPLLNGKGKRIKNKQVVVKSFEVENLEDRIIKVIDFEVVK